jgi:tetratricopeptide (TPR) repeat protein
MMKPIVYILFLAHLLSVIPYQGVAQTSYQQRYLQAKALFKEGKYNLAQEAFRELIPRQSGNPFSEYASFYYALSAYHQGYRAVARDMLLQIKSIYPSWNQIGEVNLWLARIHFDDKNYFQALHVLQEIDHPKLLRDKMLLKEGALKEEQDVHVLKSLYDKYPDDEIVAQALARMLRQSGTREDRWMLEKLIERFGWKKELYADLPPPSVKKKVYNVATLFPFLASTLEPTPLRKRNQFALDLYEGMKMAVDSLRKMDIHINLLAYDTERNPDLVRRLMEQDELKSVDLLVGPLFPEENKPIQDFSRKNRINLFNPVTLNYDLVSDNPYGFLFQPSLEIIGQASALFLDKYKTNKKCMVFMGDTKRDSILAYNFLKKAVQTQLKIIQIERFSRAESGKIISILATPTEFDEFKYPKQFTLPRDSLGCIFVASDDPLIYTKVISSVETRRDSVTILGSESWLDQTSVDFEKYQQLGIVLFAPNFVQLSHPEVQRFQHGFVRMHGRPSSSSQYTDYARLGYEFMFLMGQLLKNGGVYFQHDRQMHDMKTIFGRRVGYDEDVRCNRYVPFVTFRKGELISLHTERP